MKWSPLKGSGNKANSFFANFHPLVFIEQKENDQYYNYYLSNIHVGFYIHSVQIKFHFLDVQYLKTFHQHFHNAEVFLAIWQHFILINVVSYFWTDAENDTVPEHVTPTSSWCPQLCTPKPLCKQSIIVFSQPPHVTSSSQIGSLPFPKYAAGLVYAPMLYYIEKSPNWKIYSLIHSLCIHVADYCHEWKEKRDTDAKQPTMIRVHSSLIHEQSYTYCQYKIFVNFGNSKYLSWLFREKYRS